MAARAVPVFTAVLAGLVCALLAGCGPDCQSTCNRIYQPSECGIAKPGRTSNELTRSCISECNSALQSPGTLGDYDPTRRRSSSAAIILENEKQAAAWMDCVWDVAPDATPAQCADLDPASGYCAPI